MNLDTTKSGRLFSRLSERKKLTKDNTFYLFTTRTNATS